MVGGIPILALVFIAIGAASAIFMVRQLQVLTRQLGGGSQGQAALQGVLYAGETKLHDLGVHRMVWTIRAAFIFETLCILAAVYFIYMAELAK